MKNLKIFIIISVLVGLGCQQKKTNTETIKHPFISASPNAEMMVEVENPINNYMVLNKDRFNDTAFINSKNRYIFSIYLDTPTYSYLRDGKNNLRVFISPDDTLKIKYDLNHIFESIAFSGKGCQANQYIRNKYLLMLDHAIPVTRLYEMPVKKFRYLVDSFYVVDKLFLEDFILKNPDLPEVFKNSEQASLTYDRATTLTEYLGANQNLDRVDTANYLKYLNKVDLNQEKWLDIYEYRSFLQSYINFYTLVKHGTENLSSGELTLKKMYEVLARIQNQKIKDYLLFTLLHDQVKYYGYKNTDALFTLFEQQCKNESMKKGLLTPYQDYQKLKQKEKAPEFVMLDVNGRSHNLNEFKGRYIYIDVWATWCLPCKKELPIFEQLAETYKNKNIEFVSLSIDNKEADWKEFLEIKKLAKNQFIVTNTKELLDTYMIKTVPHYLIIDDKGILIDNDAPRPSEGKTEWIEKLPEKVKV